MIGVCYAQGQGVAKDESKALQWWQAAVAQGLAGAQYALGLCDRACPLLRSVFVLSVLISACKW
jgi:hypothetical protein